MKHLVVLDYGSGNLRSAQRALERVGAQVSVTADPRAAARADGLVVPGVGAFAACMNGLDAVGGREIIAAHLASGRPLLGICVGMQVLFDTGVEHGVRTAGLGVLTGEVTPLRAPIVPHMGWNTVRAAAGSVLFAGLDAGTRFYFVHSYAAHLDSITVSIEPAAPGPAVGAVSIGPAAPGPAVGAVSIGPAAPGPAVGAVSTSCHGEPFVAAIESGAISATQFHPEKSGDAGAALLTNWLETV